MPGCVKSLFKLNCDGGLKMNSKIYHSIPINSTAKRVVSQSGCNDVVDEKRILRENLVKKYKILQAEINKILSTKERYSRDGKIRLDILRKDFTSVKDEITKMGKIKIPQLKFESMFVDVAKETLDTFTFNKIKEEVKKRIL